MAGNPRASFLMMASWISPQAKPKIMSSPMAKTAASIKITSNGKIGCSNNWGLRTIPYRISPPKNSTGNMVFIKESLVILAISL
jgi:ribosomal protein S6